MLLIKKEYIILFSEGFYNFFIFITFFMIMYSFLYPCTNNNNNNNNNK